MVGIDEGESRYFCKKPGNIISFLGKICSMVKLWEGVDQHQPHVPEITIAAL